MKKFMGDNFLLNTESAKKLYHDYAETMPITGLPLPHQSAGRLPTIAALRR